MRRGVNAETTNVPVHRLRPSRGGPRPSSKGDLQGRPRSSRPGRPSSENRLGRLLRVLGRHPSPSTGRRTMADGTMTHRTMVAVRRRWPLFGGTPDGQCGQRSTFSPCSSAPKYRYPKGADALFSVAWLTPKRLEGCRRVAGFPLRLIFRLGSP